METIESSADAEEGMPILIDLQEVPHTQEFLEYWLQGPGHITLSRLVMFPPSSGRGPFVVGYSQWAEYQQSRQDLLLKIPSWAPDLWPVVKDGHFIALKWENGRLVRVNGPVRLFNAILNPKPKEEKPPLKLTREGKQLLGDPDFHDWPSLRNDLPYLFFH